MLPLATFSRLWTWTHDDGFSNTNREVFKPQSPPKDMDQHEIETLPEFYPGQYAVEDFEDAR